MICGEANAAKKNICKNAERKRERIRIDVIYYNPLVMMLSVKYLLLAQVATKQKNWYFSVGKITNRPQHIPYSLTHTCTHELRRSKQKT